MVTVVLVKVSLSPAVIFHDFPLGNAITYTSAMCQNWQSAWQLLEEAPVAQSFG